MLAAVRKFIGILVSKRENLFFVIALVIDLGKYEDKTH